MRVLYTGSSGFVAGFAIPHLLEFGHAVIGIDDKSKYGKNQKKEFDSHPNFTEHEIDLSTPDSVPFLRDLIQEERVTHVVMGACKIGGIGYFNRQPYWLQTVSDRINSNTLDAVILSSQHPKVVYMSSSMVFERTDEFPTPEAAITRTPVPITNYGMQKLTGEYYLQGAIAEYGIFGTIIRPFNCVGVGEYPELDEKGEFLYGHSHVLPDLCVKILSNPKKITIFGNGTNVRAYTNGRDLASAILKVLLYGQKGESYNASTPETASVLQLIAEISQQLGIPSPEVILTPGFPHDVQYRIGDSTKLKMLGWTPSVTLDQSIAEVLEYCKQRMGED